MLLDVGVGVAMLLDVGVGVAMLLDVDVGVGVAMPLDVGVGVAMPLDVGVVVAVLLDVGVAVLLGVDAGAISAVILIGTHLVPPAEVTATTLMVYLVPLCSPVKLQWVPTFVVLKEVHFPLSSLLYSTT